MTILGIAGLIFTAVLFANSGGDSHDIKSMIIFGALGLLFFASGISLIQATKDQA